MNKPIKIFLVEDDLNFGAILRSYLELNDYEVTWVDDGAKAIAAFRADVFQLCILDVMLPNTDGFTIGRSIRQTHPVIPLIFLTAKSLKDDILEGFRIGADDYITKPFDSEVLLFKIKAILKRHEPMRQSEQPREYLIGKYIFNPFLRTLSFESEMRKLSPKETELLKLLCQAMNDVLPREMALKTIWGDDNYFTTRSMDVFITKLRKYLVADSDVEIENIHGSGYRLIVK
ncbi:MAG: response regulator transcription factor [Bacteroidales bacterium]|nr:response regulator transcription factor [Bacteroidales bacterium]